MRSMGSSFGLPSTPRLQEPALQAAAEAPRALDRGCQGSTSRRPGRLANLYREG
jgi:hypothetical protein